MKVEIVQGDLIDMVRNGTVGAVAHNCNCFHVMGTGIAKALNDHTQGQLLREDKTTTKGDINKLGGFSYMNHKNVKYYNLYGMFVYKTLLKSYRNDDVFVNWSCLKYALKSAIIDADVLTFGIPILGCSHAGGNYNDFIDMVECIVKELDINTTLIIVYQ